MANTKSALKRQRQNEKRRLHNRMFRNRARTLVKKARAALTVLNTAADAKKEEAAQSAEAAVRIAVRDLDKAASRGTIHKRNAARRKSRLMKQLAALKK